MLDELEDLKDRNAELLQQNLEYEQEAKDAKEEMLKAQELVKECEEKIEFLEEAEEMWREKLTAAKLEMGRITQALERASLVSNDRECGLIKTILELRHTNKVFAKYRRRRGLMLEATEESLRRRQNADEQSLVMRMWGHQSMKDHLTLQLETLERRRRQEVGDLQMQLQCERFRVAALEANVGRLEARLRQAAHRLLARSLSVKDWPSASSHAFRVWSASVPVVILEDALAKALADLKESNELLERESNRTAFQGEDLALTTSDRDDTRVRLKIVTAERDAFWEDLREWRDPELVAARLAAERAKEKAWEDRLAEEHRKFMEFKKLAQQAQDELEIELKATLARMAQLEFALESSNGAGKKGLEDDNLRVVPKGTGVLCVGCLQQLVHRAVRPLPAKTLMSSSMSKLEVSKRRFYEQTLDGMPSADDPMHTEAFQGRRDPYGLVALQAWPSPNSSAVGRKTPRVQTLSPSGREPPPPPAPHSSRGLPSLRDPKKPESVTALRRSMQDFRVRVFR